jgi:hypothetical protein
MSPPEQLRPEARYDQLAVANVHHFQYPLWPPKAIVNMVQAYGRKYDPLLMAYSGLHRSPHFAVVLLNLPWLALPVATIVRMAREHPFTEPRPAALAGPVAAAAEPG